MTFRLNVKEKGHTGISLRLGGISILRASQNLPAHGRCPAT